MDQITFWLTQMLTGLEMHLIENPQQVFAHLLEGILSFKIARNKLLLLDLVQKLSIGPWHQWPMNLIWLKCSSFRARIHKHDTICPCIVITKLSCGLPSNPVFHEGTKHIEVDCYYIHAQVQSKVIDTMFTRSHNQLADLFTKALDSTQFQHLLCKLGSINPLDPA